MGEGKEPWYNHHSSTLSLPCETDSSKPAQLTYVMDVTQMDYQTNMPLETIRNMQLFAWIQAWWFLWHGDRTTVTGSMVSGKGKGICLTALLRYNWYAINCKYTVYNLIYFFLFIFLFNLYCIFSITIHSSYTPLPPAISTLLSMSMSPFSFLSNPSTP